MKFREVERKLKEAGLREIRQNGSHHIYEGFVHDKRRLVTLAAHHWNDDLLPKTPASIIRQSGLPKSAFR